MTSCSGRGRSGRCGPFSPTARRGPSESRRGAAGTPPARSLAMCSSGAGRAPTTATGRSIPTRFRELIWTAPCDDRRDSRDQGATVNSPPLPGSRPAGEWPSTTHRFVVDGHKGYTMVSDEHDRPVHLEIRMSRAGGVLRGLLDSLADQRLAGAAPRGAAVRLRRAAGGSLVRAVRLDAGPRLSSTGRNP